MALSTLAPAPTDVTEIKPTMIMSIWCTCYAIIIILFRVVGRWIRTKTIFIEDVILLLSIIVLIARMVLIKYILITGTNNIDLSFISPQDIPQREFGSRLVLASRMLYAAYLWMIKLSVGIYLTRLINQFWAAKASTSNSSGGRIIKTFLSKYNNTMFYSFLGLSFLGVFLSEMIECKPFTHYWQVVPDPGSSCRQSYGQLFTMGGFNMYTDLILIAVPLPMMLDARLDTKIKLESMVLMLFPLANVTFTIYRLQAIVSTSHLGSQQFRTLMASVDILISTASANALVVTSFLQGRGFKKTNYKKWNGPEDDGVVLGHDGMELIQLDTIPGARMGEGRAQIMKRYWGSDEDLVRNYPDGTSEGHNPTHRFPSKHLSSEDRSSAGAETIQMDDCSIKSTSMLSPYHKAETNISVGRTDETGDAAQVITMPEPSQQGGIRGIVVSTTWHVGSSPKSSTKYA